MLVSHRTSQRTILGKLVTKRLFAPLLVLVAHSAFATTDVDIPYERFELDDYTLVSPTTLPTILTLGANPYDYDIWAVGVGFRYNFGGGEITLAN